MTDRELLGSMSQKIGELVRHVAEVRSSSKCLEEELSWLRGNMAAMPNDIDQMRSDIDRMKLDIDTMKLDVDALKVDQRFDSRTDFLSSKMDPFTGFLYSEIARYRTALEEEVTSRQVVLA